MGQRPEDIDRLLHDQRSSANAGSVTLSADVTGTLKMQEKQMTDFTMADESAEHDIARKLVRASVCSSVSEIRAANCGRCGQKTAAAKHGRFAAVRAS